MPRKAKSVVKKVKKTSTRKRVKKSNKRVLQQWLESRIAKKPKKGKRKVLKPTFQRGKGVGLGLLGGLIPIISELIRNA